MDLALRFTSLPFLAKQDDLVSFTLKYYRNIRKKELQYFRYRLSRAFKRISGIRTMNGLSGPDRRRPEAVGQQMQE
jgi:hypothetical protein